MSIEGPRMLDKILGGANLPTDESSLITPTGDGWNAVAASIAAQRSYFDLSGYNRDSLTAFFQRIDFQYAGPPITSDEVMQVIDILTTEYVSDAEIIATIGNSPVISGVFSGPGYPESTMNMEQVIYARRRIYTKDTASGQTEYPNLLSLDLWGTCSATTADKIHITRVMFANTASATHFVPPVNVVVGIILAEEKELAFLMRQKRSYELATGP